MTGHAIIITGTDTGIGKTVFAAALTGALGAYYWKPVQAGLEQTGHPKQDPLVPSLSKDAGTALEPFDKLRVSGMGTDFPQDVSEEDDGDSERVARLAGIAPDRVLAEAYRLATPCSPHRAAEIDGVVIDPARLALPQVEGPLVIEGAGGVLVPLTREMTYADQFASWRCPVVLVTRTTLGTINHSLLSIEALRARGTELLGVAFVGEPNEDSETTICAMGRVRRLGRLPHLDPLTPETLRAAFAANFRLEDFTR